MATLGGIVAAQILLAFPALFFLACALRGGLPSRRSANFALACGFAVLILPEQLSSLSASERPALFVGIAITRVALGITGLVLAVLATSRRGDCGVGPPRLLAAIVLSLLHAGVGTAALLYADRELPGPQRIYASPDDAFQLTLPPGRWEKVKEPKSVVAFSNKRPQMFVTVRTASREQTSSDFDALAQLMIDRIESVPRIRGKLQMEDGKTPSGNSYRYFSGLSHTPGGAPIFAAYSVVWSPRTGVLVEISFEGEPKKLAAAGVDQELGTIEQAARLICLSVE